jgi:serine/threonine-protein kinase RsbW
MSESPATGSSAPMQPSDGLPHGGDRVTLTIPANSAYLSVVRTATAALAARQDFTLDDVEDLRIAADEACSLLVSDALPGSSLTCAFELGDAALSLSVTTDVAGGRTPDRDSFAWTVLSALADDLSASSDGDAVTLVLTKQRDGVRLA